MRRGNPRGIVGSRWYHNWGFLSCVFQSSLYKTVVDDVITNVKEAFLDEGVDEQVLQELKQVIVNLVLVDVHRICFGKMLLHVL